MARKTDKPAPTGVSANRTGFDLTLYGPVTNKRNAPDFGQSDNIAKKGEPGLWIAERVIPIFPFESRETRFFTLFNTEKKVMIGAINPPGHVLQNLGVNCLKSGIFRSQVREPACLIIVIQGSVACLVGLDPFLEKSIVEIPAYSKGFL
jgi:hypothetical protein